MGSLSLLQGIFPTEGSNPGLPHCRWILHQLSHKRSARMGSLSLLQQIFPTQEWNWDLLHCRWILYELSYQGSPTSSWLLPFIYLFIYFFFIGFCELNDCGHPVVTSVFCNHITCELGETGSNSYHLYPIALNLFP